MTDLAALEKLRDTLASAVAHQQFNRIQFFQPYPKQKLFCDLSATRHELLLMAGNQVGKSEIGAVAAACHLTGEYPGWWEGRRWDRPTRGWIVGETGLVVRDVQQKKLCGEAGVLEAFGTGMVPKDAFVGKPTLSRGVADAYDTIQVRHKSGGVSIGRFKSYEQGRTKFQGETLDWAWCDEEPDEEIYTEIVTRVAATNGLVYLTFTPLLGRSKVVNRFLDAADTDRGVVHMTIDDAGHFSPAEREAVISRYPTYQREARARGIPMMGSGVIYTAPESMICEPGLEYVPQHWRKIWGVDFGIGHPFAAVLLLHDTDNDTIHVHHTIKMTDTVPLQHAAAMKAIAEGVPVAWPHDGTHREKGSGDPLAAIYRKEKLRMLGDHATFADGSISPEAGITDIDAREKSGRWRVAFHLSDYLEERRLYHRRNGIIHKERDDVLDAARTGFMARRYAQAVPLGAGQLVRRNTTGIASGVDFDVFGAR